MKKLFVAALSAVAVMVAATQAGATMTTISKINYLPSNSEAIIRGVYVNIPALAQNDSAQFVFNVQGLYGMQEYDGAAFVSNIIWGTNSTTGTDSFTVNVQGSFSPTGVWTSMYAGTLQANTIVGCGTATQQDNATGWLAQSTGMYVAKLAAASSTLLPFPYYRVQFRLKGSAAVTAAQAKKFYVIFPQARKGRVGIN